MFAIVKRIVLSALSVLGISMVVWTVFLMNPEFSYAHKTTYDYVTIYHNAALEEHTEEVVKEATLLLETSSIFDSEIQIELCLNDDKVYPNLHPLAGQPLAYAMLDKTIIKNCVLDFEQKTATTQWEINQGEVRQFDLPSLLAHEVTHNLQFNTDAGYVLSSTLGRLNWKLEGHAEYIARGYRFDGKLKGKIEHYVQEVDRDHIGIPVRILEDGTLQNLSYFKYALLVQYLMETKGVSFEELCVLDVVMEDVYLEMLNWAAIES